MNEGLIAKVLEVAVAGDEVVGKLVAAKIPSRGIEDLLLDALSTGIEKIGPVTIDDVRLLPARLRVPALAHVFLEQGSRMMDDGWADWYLDQLTDSPELIVRVLAAPVKTALGAARYIDKVASGQNPTGPMLLDSGESSGRKVG